MSKEFQMKEGNLVASFDLENEDSDVDCCKLYEVSKDVANQIKMFVDYDAITKIIDGRNQLITNLQHKLKVAEKALELACERVKYFEEMQDREMGFEDLFGYESNYDLQGIIEQYKEQAEKEIKGE